MIDIELVIHIISSSTLVGIAIVFLGAGYWNLRYLFIDKSKKRPFRIHQTIACFAVSFAYSYVLYTNLVNDPMSMSVIAGVILRPVLFYLGCSILIGARIRFFDTIKNKNTMRHVSETVDKIK